MTEQDTYSHGFDYETYIRRAFNCERGKHGAETGYLRFLLMADIGKNYLAKPYQKQFSEVKNYLLKATEKFLKRTSIVLEIKQLEKIRDAFIQANSASELVPIITEGLEKTERFIDPT
jgi:hypothetical protein